ncbi:unnamed protein product [Rotaria sp. Silwood2]|nr:unnamed protein product [Rotaria sp. Silwood2]
MSTPVNFIPTNLRLLLKLTNLTSLNLSSTDIKNPCIDIIIDSLQNLDTFDLSSCRSIKLFNSLLKLSSKLKWLNLYNCCFHMQQNPTIYHILYQLKYLEYLDISNDNIFNDNNNNNNNTNSIIDNDNDLNKFLRQDNCLPRLKHFDISGQKTISSISLYHFLLNHKNLQFLGLFLTNEKYSPCVFDKNDLCYSKYRHYTYDLQHIQTITLTENDLILYEPYLIESLKRYRDRSGFVQKILYYIFFLTRSFRSKQPNLLIELILHVISIHSNLQTVQMASTACIYNLTRTPMTERIHVKYLAQIVQATMNVMATFPNQQQLQKNCLLTLCSDRILHEPHFNFYLLATLVMHNLLHYTDLAIIQPGVAILSLLTTRLTIDECTQLGSVINLKRLLQLIEQQIDRLQTMQINQNQQAHNVQTQQTLSDIDLTLNHNQQLTSDDTLRFCLSLLWNLTDENAIVCENFIQSMGLQLFQRLLNLFSTDTIVLTKIVGLLSNIAEVSHLKIYLYSIDIIPLMQKYITEAILDVAFSAVGILAHLLYEQTDDEINLELCRQMRKTIVSWQNPHTNMELVDIQEKLQRDLNASLESQRRLNEKIQDLERKNDKLQTTVHELGETIIINDRNYQIKLTSADDENQRLKLTHKEDSKDQELRTNRDIQRLKEAHSSTEQTLKEQITKLENIRTSLEREINSLKSTISTQKLNHDETLQEEKIRIKNEEEKKQQELEDRIRALTSSKDEVESRYNQQLIAYREVQQKINFQSVEIESFKRQIESIQMTIHDKDTEILETHIDMNDELKDRIKQLENELKDQRYTDRNTIRELESRVADLQTTLNHRDQEINRFKLDEEQRLHFLRSAIVDYIGTGTNT